MTSDEALDQFEQALSADPQPDELRDEARIVSAMVEAIATSPTSPPATVLSLDNVRQARARGRRRVASVVAVAALCTTSVAAATGGIPAPELPDWSELIPNFVTTESETPDEPKPNFELGEVDLPDETPQVGDADQLDPSVADPDVPESQDNPADGPASEAEDRKRGPSDDNKKDAEDRKGGPSDDERGGNWKNLEAEKEEQDKQKPRHDQGAGATDNKGQKTRAGEPGEGHEGTKKPEQTTKQPKGQEPPD